MPSVHSDRTQATPVTFDPKRRAVIRVLLGAPILTLGAFRQGSARAQGAAAYPSRPLLLVVPYTAGTAADVLARLLGERLAARWSVPVITENRAGAAGIIGTDFVAKAAPNGYTLLFTATAHGSVPALHSNDLPFDPLRSFVPVSLLALSAFAVVVSPKLPVATLNDFLDLVRAQPGMYSYSSPGVGGPQHLIMELFMRETGIRMLHVPYRGTSGALADLVAGHVQTSIVSLQSAGPLAESGKLKVLAVMSERRAAAYPNIPTLRELGLANLVVDAWYGVLAPAGTSDDIVARLNGELDRLLGLPDVRNALARHGLTPVGGKPELLSDLMKHEVTRWSELVKEAGIVAE